MLVCAYVQRRPVGRVVVVCAGTLVGTQEALDRAAFLGLLAAVEEAVSALATLDKLLQLIMYIFQTDGARPAAPRRCALL